jgi:hypothetical protein
MATMFSVVDFGSSRAGLLTVGYRLYTQSTNSTGIRNTGGVQEIVDGKYGANVTYPDGAFYGGVVWDSGELSPIYAVDPISPITVVTPDPWLTLLPGAYAEGSAGQIIGRFNIPPPDTPLVAVPAPPTDVSMCRVFGYLETLDNIPAANVTVRFTLAKQDPVKSDRIISGRTVQTNTNSAGELIIDLQRNDHLTPSDSFYLVSCQQLGMQNQQITLATDVFDLSSVIT